MNYASVASAISSNLEPFTSVVSKITGLSFDGTWSGDAHDTLTKNLKTSIDKINKQKDALNSYISALNDLQTYKDNKEKIESLSNEFNSLDDEKNASRKNQISSTISTLENNNTTLRKSIENSLKSISSVGTEFEVVNYTPDESYNGYIVDLHDILSLFQSNSLTKLSDSDSSSDSLYDFYTEDQVNSRLNQIKRQYTGRDAAVNCALGIIDMAAQVGKKLDYDWGGGHGGDGVTSTSEVATGSDCSAFASWAINQGISNGKAVGPYNLINQGSQTSFEKAQKGDILVSASHVVMIIANDPETQQFLVAEASGRDTGVIVRTRSYSALSGIYQARDLSSIYNQPSLL